MKTIILMTVLLVQITANAKSVKELTVDCDIKAKVTGVHAIKYSAGKPPHYRVPGIDPSIGFNASLEVVSQTAGCAIVDSKYNKFLSSFYASGGISPAVQSQIADVLNLENQIIDLHLNQHFGYQVEGELPLFPLVHAESMSLNAEIGKISLSIPLPFDANWVYGITPFSDLSDIEKLALAQKTLPLVFMQDFNSLFLGLEPKQPNLKKAYAILVWKAFKQKQASQFLDFYSGGYGKYLGEPLAIKLNKISHLPGAFSSQEAVLLLTEFPGWILAGNQTNECLNYSADDLTQVLEFAAAKLPVMDWKELFVWNDVLNKISGNLIFDSCIKDQMTDKNKTLVADILKK